MSAERSIHGADELVTPGRLALVLLALATALAVVGLGLLLALLVSRATHQGCPVQYQWL